MQMLTPDSPEQLAEALRECGDAGRSVHLGGGFTKRLMAGPAATADLTISTASLNRVLQYEPRDLTISVEAGMRFSDLAKLLAANRQMIPLDPPFFDHATVGGVAAANTSGPRRRLYGSVRDAVIGMKFATLEGKLVETGGMVVKNVAGLDMGKLMIGSFGTLAAIAVVNFKLHPMPEYTRTFVRRFPTAQLAIEARDAVLTSVLQPVALDLLNPPAAARAGLSDWCLLFQAGGNAAVIERYTRELSGAETLENQTETGLWEKIREFTPRYLQENPAGVVTRIAAPLRNLSAFTEAAGPAVVRAGSGITYIYGDSPQAGVIEFSPDARKSGLTLWPDPGSDFEIMRKIKDMFDPRHLLNRGRLYGRI